jgi:hypothetical protein
MIVWSGTDRNQTIGGRYNPATNNWTMVKAFITSSEYRQRFGP